jgi:hypothetical protein
MLPSAHFVMQDDLVVYGGLISRLLPLLPLRHQIRRKKHVRAAGFFIADLDIQFMMFTLGWVNLFFVAPSV